MRPPEPRALARTRRAIDHIDDALLRLLAGRARLAVRAGQCKRAAGLPLRDHGREARVHACAHSLAARIGLPAATARGVIATAIDDARARQGLAASANTVVCGFSDLHQGRALVATGIIANTMPTSSDAPSARQRLLRLLPPPARLAPWLRLLPASMQRRLLERAMARVLAAPLEGGALAFLRGRRLGIDVVDLGLHWVVELRGNRLITSVEAPEASVRGSATDLLLLASRLEDADTLFFQRRLMLTGDTELGLTARNVLDRLPWESVPLALRIALNRGARFARAARDAHRGHA